MRDDFIPLLFAGDINVYSVARAFHEEYGIKPQVYGKYMTWPCADSKIMNYTANSKADVSDVFFALVTEFADANKHKKVILIGCGDSYVQLISSHMKKFPKNVIAPYIELDMMLELTNKEKFYEICEKTGIDYPDTFVHRKETAYGFELTFDGPFIIKPSNGVMYWQHPFAGQKKVFKAKDRAELEQILKSIYDSGYDDSLIIQNFIPGDDSYMRVLTNYSDKSGKVRMMCLGHVLLEEHTPLGIGNHAVIITEHNEELESKFKVLLESMNYIGYSNFDIKYDKRDGKFKVFEINTRQGRSNYYVTHAGENVARYIVEDYIDNKEYDFKSVKNESLWLVVPKKVAFDYVASPELKTKMKTLISEGKCVNPLNYSYDRAFARRLRFCKSQIGHFFKYRKYLGKNS